MVGALLLADIFGPVDFDPWGLAFIWLTLVALAGRDQYRRRMAVSVLGDLPTLIVALSVSAAIILFGRHLTSFLPAPAALLNGMLAAAAGLILARIVISALQRVMLSRGYGYRRTLICGHTETAHQINERLRKQPGLGLRPVAFSDLALRDDVAPGDVEAAYSEGWLRSRRIEHVIVAAPPDLSERYTALLIACNRLAIPTSYVAQGVERRVAGSEFPTTAGIPLLRLGAQRPVHQVNAKHALDRAVAGVGLVLLSPVLAGVAIAIRVSMGSPILFRQRRVGINGDEFQMLKFRSMEAAGNEPEDSWETAAGLGPGGVEGTDRRTGVGKFLRRSSLDELPQLINVLRGEMSLVGPRPERPEYVKQFVSEVDRYEQRHRVRVGITGLAQIQGLRGQTSLDDRIEMDNYYIENWSLWLDVQILARTLTAVVSDRPD